MHQKMNVMIPKLIYAHKGNFERKKEEDHSLVFSYLILKFYYNNISCHVFFYHSTSFASPTTKIR